MSSARTKTIEGFHGSCIHTTPIGVSLFHSTPFTSSSPPFWGTRSSCAPTSQPRAVNTGNSHASRILTPDRQWHVRWFVLASVAVINECSKPSCFFARAGESRCSSYFSQDRYSTCFALRRGSQNESGGGGICVGWVGPAGPPCTVVCVCGIGHEPNAVTRSPYSAGGLRILPTTSRGPQKLQEELI